MIDPVEFDQTQGAGPMHHPPPELLVDHAVGSLHNPWAVGVATHLSLCPRCRREARQIETLGGALLEELSGAAMADGALDNALSRLDEPAEGPLSPAVDSVLPAPLRNHLGHGTSIIAWRRLLPGVHEYRLPAEGDVRMSLLRLMPGRSVPRHGHRGEEMTVVLQGAYADGVGEFRRGDMALAGAGVDHRPRALREGPCICLIVSERSLRFSGLLGPVFNLFAA